MPTLRPSSQHIDLSTAEGKKIYQREIEGSSEKLSFESEKALETKHLLETKVKKLGLTTEMGTFATDVEMDAQGHLQIAKSVNAMLDYHKIDSDRISVNGGIVFQSSFVDNNGDLRDGKEHDYTVNINDNDRDEVDKAMRVDILAQWMMNSMNTKDQLIMNKDKELFEYQDGNETYLDGTAMAVLLLQQTQPLTKHSINNLKKKIRNCDPKKFDSMADALVHVERTYKEIIEKKGSHADLVLDLFQIASRSSDKKMVAYSEKMQERYEDGEIELSAQELMKKLKQKELTLKDRKIAESSQTDVKTSTLSKQGEEEIKLTVLINEIHNKIEKLEGSKSFQGSSGNTSNQGVIEAWRYVKQEGSMNRDGKTWHWCSHHNNGKGMYVTHPESEHAEWEERKRRQKRDKISLNKGNTSGPSKSSGNEQVKVNPNLKQALATKGFSQEQIAALLEDSGTSDFGSSRC
jgi:hypothetical protein